MFQSRVQTVALAAVSVVHPAVAAPRVAAVSVPDALPQSQGTVRDSGVRSLSGPPFPFDVNLGIGNLFDPGVAPPGSGINPSEFTLHQTVNVVDLSLAYVDIVFTEPVVLSRIDIVQHHNGVKTLELLIGETVESLVSVGTVTRPENTVEWLVAEFDFGAPAAAPRARVRIVEPELPGQGGWAFYRMRLFDALGREILPQGCVSADLAYGLGQLDVNDVLAFAGAFNAMDDRADLFPKGGDGSYDVNDILSFATSFNQGCR